MRKLLNTLYVTNEEYYLARDRQNIVIKDQGKIKARFPIHILEGVVCFNYIGASPEVIRLCNENNISITFLSPTGRMCGKFIGTTNGNVLLRREQYRIADDNRSLEISKLFIQAKIINSRKIYLRLLRDHKEKIDVEKIQTICDELLATLEAVQVCQNKDSLRGIEGDAARTYFQNFDSLILKDSDDFKFVMRSRRPPLNRVNAMLSFVYALLSYEMQTALETVGLDSYVGFFHADRPGRIGLALDMVEEFRAYLGDRFVLSMINRGQISKVDFEIKENGATLLNDKGREKILAAWQKRKQGEVRHPFTKEKMPLGLVPYVQSQLLSRYIRGDIEKYPPFIS